MIGKENIENTERMTEKAFLRLIGTSIAALVLTLALLCSTTWAWFSKDISSSQNQIQAGQGNLTVTVKNSSDQEINIDDPVKLSGGTYKVTLTRPVGSASGYCVIGYNGTSYHTQYIERNTGTEPKTLSFDLIVPDGNAKDVVFEERWGIYSGDIDVGAQGTLDLSGNTSTVSE